MGQQLFATVLVGADRHGLLSDEHFTVDGTLIEAAASLKSFKSKGGEPASDDGDPGKPVGGLSRGRNGAIRPTKAPRTRKPDCFGKAKGRKPSWCSWPTP